MARSRFVPPKFAAFSPIQATELTRAFDAAGRELLAQSSPDTSNAPISDALITARRNQSMRIVPPSGGCKLMLPPASSARVGVDYVRVFVEATATRTVKVASSQAVVGGVTVASTVDGASQTTVSSTKALYFIANGWDQWLSAPSGPAGATGATGA